MNLKKLVLILACGFSVNAMAAEKLIPGITRTAGGQVVKHSLDEKALAATVDLQALSFKILVRAISYTTVTGAKKSVPLSQIIASNSQAVADAKGLFLLPGTLPVRVSISDLDPALSLSLQVESYGGVATLKIASYVTKSAGPLAPQPPTLPPVVQPPSPSQDQVLENQCSVQLPEATAKLSACSQLASTESATNTLRRDQKSQWDVSYQQALRPLQNCQENLSQAQSFRQQLGASLSTARSNLSNAKYQLANVRGQMVEAAKEREGKLYNCTVRGRHESFRASAATKALALVQALKACGLNNCGKKDWNSANWSCEIH